MLRIAEHFHDSDLGRQRQGNEDSYYARAPLFVVADGMGGAQAGEVASALAVRQFEGGLPDVRDPGEALVALIERANAQIHEESKADADRAGMGTTVTAAYVTGDAVVVAHVGDSRAYLLRDGDLHRLTRDHSLVGELIAQGKLTEEQAEAHPQRSVITRALGAAPSVEVDLAAFPGRADDVFLVCSDGLTAMVGERQVQAVLEGKGSLERKGRALIAAANEAGGRDNITVILFRLEEVQERRAGAGAPAARSEIARTAEFEAFAGDARPTAEQRASGGDARPTVEQRASDEQEAAYRRSGTVALEAIRPRAPGESRAGDVSRETLPARGSPLPSERGRRRRRRRLAPAGLVALVLVVPLLVAGWLATRAVYFVGTDARDGRTVAIFRGLPYDLPLGVRLYERYYDSGVTLAQVPPQRRGTFTDHKLRSRDDAEELVIALEKGSLE
jgi:protein phosphatase